MVTKLFAIVEPDIAVFGEKDLQQLLVVRRMVADLDLPVEVVGMPIVREEDGLAMSSRNARLKADDRARAVALPEALLEAERAVGAGEVDAYKVRMKAIEAIEGADIRVDYVEVVSAIDLQPMAVIRGEVVMAVAVFVGDVRLIDNRRIRPPTP